MIVASCAANSLTKARTSSTSPVFISGPAVILTRTPFAFSRLISSKSGLPTAAEAASFALLGPFAIPVPIIAVPFSDITVLTS